MKKILLFLLFVFIFLSIKTVSAQNYGLTFTNQNAYAQVPVDPTLELTGPLTLEAWIYPTAWKTDVYQGCILNKEGLDYQGYMLRCGASGTLNFNIGSGTAWKELSSSSGALVLNTWQHVAGVYDGTVLKIYVNGVQVGSTLAYTGAVATNTAIPLEIGRSNYYPDRNFLGRVDEVRIFNSAVSSADIATYYNSTITAAHPNYATLVGYYEMDNFNTDTDADGNLDFTATVGISGEVFSAPYSPACNALFTSTAPAGSTSIEAYQSTTDPASLGETNQHILRIAVDAFADADISQMVFRTNGTTNVSDILNARVWYTGSNESFSPTTQFGTAIANPPAANSDMTFTGLTTISCGRNYFWLTYDINPNATLTNLIDGTFISATINGTPYNPTTSDPAGSRPIAATCPHTLQITSIYYEGWYGGLVDVNVNGSPVLTGIGSTFTSGYGPITFSFDAGTGDIISIVRTNNEIIPENMRVAVLDGNGTSILSAVEPTSTGVTTTGYCGGIVHTTAATLITAYSAQLNGDYANCIPSESGFRYKKTAETTWNFVQDFNNPMAYDLQGLDPATNYHYQSYAIVGVDTLWGTTVSFATTCVPYTIPFAESFNSTTIPLCWTNSSSNPFNFVTSGTLPSATPFFGSGMARFAGYSYTSGQVGYLVTPALDNLTTGMEVRFWFNRQDYNNSYTVGALRVKANSTNNPTNAVLLTTIQRVYNQAPAELTPGWYEYVAVIPADTFTHIIFECTSDYYANMYLDEVTIDYPATCPRPPATSVTVPVVLNNSATINWLRGGLETEWEVAYKTSAETTWTTETAYDTLHTIYNLTSATTYQVKVRAVCAPGDESLYTFEKTFTTMCDPISTLPIIENCETTPSNELPLCFSKIVSGNATVYVESYSSNKVVRLTPGATTNKCFLLLPALTEPVNNIRVQFKYIGGDNHIFKIGYFSDPTDTASFVQIYNPSISGSGTWKTFDIVTTNTMTGSEIIAIGLVMPSGSYVYLDSITISLQPQCIEPISLTVDNSNLNDITLSWLTLAPTSNLEYKESTTSTWTTLAGVTSPYTISGLTQNTAYNFRVQAVCDGGVLSAFTSTITYSTLCEIITVLPYVQDFESTAIDQIPSCFERIVSGTANVKVVNSDGSNVLNFDAGSTSNNCFIVLPKVDLPVNTLRIMFKYYGGPNHVFKIGYLTNPSLPSSFVELYNASLSTSGTWKTYDLNTAATLTGNERIALRFYMGYGYSARIDSLTIMEMPSCVPPFGLTATNITGFEATLNWTSAPVSTPVDYTLEYKTNTETVWTSVSNVNPPYTLPLLQPMTNYQFRVQANCSSTDISDFSTSASFTTLCAPLTPPTVSETFATVTPNQCWSMYSGNLPDTGNVVLTPVSYGWGVRTNIAPNTAYSNIYNNNKYWLVTPSIDLGDGTSQYQIDFDLARTAYSSTNIGTMDQSSTARFVVLISTDNGTTWNSSGILKEWNNSTGTPFSTLTNSLSSQSIPIFDSTAMVPYSGIVKFAFLAYSNENSTTYDNDIHIDNFQVNPYNSCSRPSNFSNTSITSNSVNLQWIETGSATSWNIEYGPVGFTQGTGTVVPNITTNPYLLQGLTPNTTYQLYVQSDCGGGSTSNYSLPITITTGLIPVTLPYNNDFENPTTYSDFGFLNGTQVNKFVIGSASGVNNTVGGSNALYISNDNGTTWAYTGGSSNASRVYSYIDIDVPSGANEILLDFDWIAKGSLYNYEFLRVYLMPLNVPMAAGANPPTFNSVNYDAAGQIGNYTGGVGEHWLSQQTTWQHKQFNINTTQFPNLAGNTWRLYFHWRNDQSSASQPPATIDNISITVVSCATPTNLLVNSISSSDANLAWTGNGAATEWQIEYGPAGFTHGTGNYVTATTNPFTITSLSPSTTYDFYVRAICGAGDTSAWSNKVVAATQCVPITVLPWNEGFESITAATQLPSCWSATSFGTYTNTQITDATAHNRIAHTGTGSAYFQWSCDDRFFTPGFELTAGVTYNFSYWYITDGASGFSTLQLGAYSSQLEGSLVQTINTVTDPTNMTYAQVNATFTPTTTSVYYFGIYCQANYDPWYVTIDDFSLTTSTATTCTSPTNLAISSVTSSTAIATWTAGGTESQWELTYKPTTASTWNSVFVTAPTYNFSILTTATTYDVKVRAICAVGDTSAYTAIVNFTTGTQSCATPTNLTATAINTAGATIAWTAGGSETSWELDYKLASASTWTTVNVNTTPSHILNTLVPSTAYNVRVRAVCGSGLFSSYTSVTNFSTALTPCIVPTGVNIPSAGITDQSAVVMWTAGGTESQWQVEYKLVSSSNWTTMAISTSTAQLIQALQSNSTYEVRVKAICGAGNESPFTTPVQFTTTGAGTFTITASASGPGTITPSGTVVVNAGNDQTFTFTPTGSALVIALLLDNQPTAFTNNEYTFTNVLANHTIEVHFESGIDENQLSKMVTLYPNPTNSMLEIKLDEVQLEVKECHVYDIYGKLLQVVSIQSDITTIDVTHFAAGVYFVRLNSEMGIITKKFVKK